MISADTVAVIVTILLAVGAAYVGLGSRISALESRMSRLEGVIEGWLNPPPQKEAQR